jgi:hypothetical protein
MESAHNERAAPAFAGSDPFKSVLLGGGDRKIDGTTHHLVQDLRRRRVRLRRLLAKLGTLVIWRDDILYRIDRAMQLQERGALFAIEQDDLIAAVAAWRLAAAGVVLDLDAFPEVADRRADA